ncbi:hypothetical protein [Rhodanobacter sp. MP1X3]|uniref:hypothetical protein n=1 Tax=Rhodanobacter sp. MP1X3 TaxID=2723086 RepID=UPI0016165B96|nr:hypothetical protein [Rhodanobacter sp. MP1X3]MBB6244896.1 hypothetical protein [Rhodanobacter sp. MP1X3]
MNLPASANLTAWGSLVIALCALGFSIQQGFASRKHDRLSVRPKLDWTSSWVYGKAVRLSLRNNGLGPAVIGAMTVTFDGIDYVVDAEGMVSDLHASLTITGCKLEVHLMGADSSLTSGQEVDLFLFPQSGTGRAAHNQAVDVLRRIGVRIKYKSMYDVTYELRRRELVSPDGAAV